MLVLVEHRAAQRFAGHGYPRLAAQPAADAQAFARWAEPHHILVVEASDGAPAGFAAMRPVGRFLHLGELSVDPSQGRRGIGRTLVEAVAVRAARFGLAGVSLSTFRSVPFNAPFYGALGFAELPVDAAPPELAIQFYDEVPEGVDPRARLLMTRPSSTQDR